MRNKRFFLVLSLFSIGLCLFFMNSCKEKAEAPILSTKDVTDISETSAISGGNISDDKGATVTSRGVCWSTSQNPTIENNKTSDGSGTGSFTSNITNLVPKTTYYVRAYATNSAGTGYGSTMIFTTEEDNSFTDPRDGNVYKTVKIGNQIWMAENLRYLPSVVEPNTISQTTPYYYVYDFSDISVTEAKATFNYNTYGVLYNWPAACSSCPSGWHLPTDDEWTELITYLGGEEVAGSKLKEVGTTHWNSPNEGATNESGFTALPGGCRYSYGIFVLLGTDGGWWINYEYNTDYACLRGMNYNGSNVIKSNNKKNDGFSVRCIKDK